MLGFLGDKASLLKAKLKRDEVEQALIEATTEENWQASTTVLHQISSASYNYEKWQQISTFIWEKLNKAKSWKKTLKVLNIIEFLLKNGSENIFPDLKTELHHFRSLQSYTVYEENVERGGNIRQRAKAIVNLLSDPQFLEDERRNARKIRQRMAGVAGMSAGSTGGKYQSFNSKTFDNNKESGNYFNYGKGNYGDRNEENRFQRENQEIEGNLHKRLTTDTNTFAVHNNNQTNTIKKSPEKKVNLPFQNKKQNNTKPTYETMAQKLMRPTKPVLVNNQPQIKLPSVKQKEQSLLIDTEAYFIENKYKNNQQPKQTTQNLQKPPITPPPFDPQQLLFGSNAPSQSNTFNQNKEIQQKQKTAQKPTIIQAPVQNQTPTPNQNTNQIQNNQYQSNQQLPSDPIYKNPSISLGYSSIPIQSAQNYGNNFNSSPPYPYAGYNQPINVNPYNPYAQNMMYSNPYQNNTFNGYAPQPYLNQPYMNPYTNINSNPFYSTPQNIQQQVYQSNIQPKIMQTNNISQNNYPPINTNNIIPSNMTSVSLTPSKNQANNEFGKFQQCQKPINAKWLTSEEKMLTDLTDFTFEVANDSSKENSPVRKAPDEYSNRIKMDNWSWY